VRARERATFGCWLEKADETEETDTMRQTLALPPAVLSGMIRRLSTGSQPWAVGARSVSSIRASQAALAVS